MDSKNLNRRSTDTQPAEIVGGRRCTDRPCDIRDIVVEHVGAISALSEIIDRHRKLLENGLMEQMDALHKALSDFKTETAMKFIDISPSNWLGKVLASGVRKATVTGIVVLLFILANAVASTALWAVFKAQGFKERPGQQENIMKTLNSSYHTHMLNNGKVLVHAGDKDLPAGIFDPITKQLVATPEFRTEDRLHTQLE
jgi:hypothetical protein